MSKGEKSKGASMRKDMYAVVVIVFGLAGARCQGLKD